MKSHTTNGQMSNSGGICIKAEDYSLWNLVGSSLSSAHLETEIMQELLTLRTLQVWQLLAAVAFYQSAAMLL